MSATSQHGFHPDAENLSAFAEQALEGRERAEVLSHLAVCGRCRQVVALAREAADADTVNALEKPRKTIEPNAWWRRWRLVWVPTAIVAAFAVASISVFVLQTDRHGSDSKIVALNPTPGAAPSSTPSPTQQAEVNKFVSPSPAPPAPAAKHTHPAAPQPLPTQARSVVSAQISPEPSAVDHVESMRETPPSPPAAQQAPPELAVGAVHPAYSQPTAGAWEAKQKQAEEQYQSETSRRRFAAANSAPGTGSGGGANQPAPPAATQTITVAAAPPMIETQSDGLAEPLPALGISSLLKAPTPVKQIHLPSQLAAVSSTSTGPFMLAIDKAGALFVSKDQGDTWERIHRQWKGHAVEVTQQSAANAGMSSASTAQTETAPGTPGNAGAASTPPVIFELLNDKGQAWISTDGRTWTSK